MLVQLAVLANGCLVRTVTRTRDLADAAEHQEHSADDRHAPPLRNKQPQRGGIASLRHLLMSVPIAAFVCVWVGRRPRGTVAG